jgi:hypothetical protein
MGVSGDRWKEREEGRQRERERVGTKIYPKGIYFVTYFLQLGPTP